ncbi:hypothetical protein [Paraburkholderia sp.]|uniref:hypothetical protein n=1 Tax=Paraburkholderia sp. TaxID=1926495 RepID=UPI00286F4B3E|nr:hypothetical protein [Paraburkholderia sp.]
MAVFTLLKASYSRSASLAEIECRRMRRRRLDAVALTGVGAAATCIALGSAVAGLALCVAALAPFVFVRD